MQQALILTEPRNTHIGSDPEDEELSCTPTIKTTKKDKLVGLPTLFSLPDLPDLPKLRINIYDTYTDETANRNKIESYPEDEEVSCEIYCERTRKTTKTAIDEINKSIDIYNSHMFGDLVREELIPSTQCSEIEIEAETEAEAESEVNATNNDLVNALDTIMDTNEIIFTKSENTFKRRMYNLFKKYTHGFSCLFVKK